LKTPINTLTAILVASGLLGCRLHGDTRGNLPSPAGTEPVAAAVASDSVGDHPNTSRLWKQYIAAKQSGDEPVLADFSYAGYHWGEVPIPTVDWQVFDVTQFGAVPDDGKSDREAISKAIAAAEANGSGVIFFPKGKFLINEQNDSYNKPIVIRGSRIVLRGSGSEIGGTELFMDRYMDPTNPKKLWSCPYLIQFQGEESASSPVAVIANVRRETHTVQVASTASFKVGDWVVLSLEDNSPAAVAAAVAPFKPDPAWTSLIKDGVQIDEFHCIEAIKGNQLVFKEPIHVDVDHAAGWKVSAIRPLEEVGVEQIAFCGNWHEEFVHHKSPIHDGGWSMLTLTRCVNSWVRNCRFTDLTRSLVVRHSSSVTVQDLLLDGNRGHSAVSLHGTSHSLVQRVKDTAGHWHASGVAEPSSGNVFLRCEYRDDTCYESHASQPRWTLFDNISGGWMYGRWGGAENNQPNHMRGLVLWNYNNTGTGEPGDFHFMRPDSKFGRNIMPYVIGFHGGHQRWAEAEIEVLESNGAPVYPASLYEAQFELRMNGEK